MKFQNASVFLGLTILSLSCGTSHSRHTTTPVAQTPTPTPTPVPPKDQFTPLFDILKTFGETFSCTRTTDGSMRVTMHWPDKDKVVVMDQEHFSDAGCQTPTFRIIRSGIFAVKSKADDGLSAQVAITFDQDFWSFAVDAPQQLQDRCPAVEFRKAGFHHSSNECQLALPSYEATWKVATETNKQSRMTIVSVSDEAFGFPEVTRSTENDILGITRLIPDQFRCEKEERAHFWDRNALSCQVATGWVRANESSLIEYAKDNGIFPRVIDEKRLVTKATGDMLYLIDYTFTCEAIGGGKNAEDELFLIGTENEFQYLVTTGQHHLEIVSHKDLTLTEDRTGMAIFFLGSKPRVKDGCSLEVKVDARVVTP